MVDKISRATVSQKASLDAAGLAQVQMRQTANSRAWHVRTAVSSQPNSPQHQSITAVLGGNTALQVSSLSWETLTARRHRLPFRPSTRLFPFARSSTFPPAVFSRLRVRTVRQTSLKKGEKLQSTAEDFQVLGRLSSSMPYDSTSLHKV